jgi:hypothetical protein
LSCVGSVAVSCNSNFPKGVVGVLGRDTSNSLLLHMLVAGEFVDVNTMSSCVGSVAVC